MVMVGTILSYVALVLIVGLVTVVHRLGHVTLVRAVYRADEDQALDFSFGHASVWARFAIVLAGPAANFLLAVLLFWGLLTFVGGSALPLMGATVGGVIQGSPAAKGGIRGRDRIVAVDGEPVETWAELARRTRPRTGEVVRLTVERETERFEVIMTTRPSPQHRVVARTGTLEAIGITRAESVVSDRLHPLTALVESGKRTAATMAMVLKGLGRVMVGAASPHTIGSSILLGHMTGVRIQRESLMPLIFLTGHLSIVLGVLSLLPLPFADGGRLCFLVIETVRGRPVSLEVERTVLWLGAVLLVAWIIVAVCSAYYEEIFQFLKTL